METDSPNAEETCEEKVMDKSDSCEDVINEVRDPSLEVAEISGDEVINGARAVYTVDVTETPNIPPPPKVFEVSCCSEVKGDDDSVTVEHFASKFIETSELDQEGRIICDRKYEENVVTEKKTLNEEGEEVSAVTEVNFREKERISTTDTGNKVAEYVVRREENTESTTSNVEIIGDEKRIKTRTRRSSISSNSMRNEEGEEIKSGLTYGNNEQILKALEGDEVLSNGKRKRASCTDCALGISESDRNNCEYLYSKASQNNHVPEDHQNSSSTHASSAQTISGSVSELASLPTEEAKVSNPNSEKMDEATVETKMEAPQVNGVAKSSSVTKSEKSSQESNEVKESKTSTKNLSSSTTDATSSQEASIDLGKLGEIQLGTNLRSTDISESSNMLSDESRVSMSSQSVSESKESSKSSMSSSEKRSEEQSQSDYIKASSFSMMKDSKSEMESKSDMESKLESKMSMENSMDMSSKMESRMEKSSSKMSSEIQNSSWETSSSHSDQRSSRDAYSSEDYGEDRLSTNELVKRILAESRKSTEGDTGRYRIDMGGEGDLSRGRRKDSYEMDDFDYRGRSKYNYGQESENSLMDHRMASHDWEKKVDRDIFSDERDGFYRNRESQDLDLNKPSRKSLLQDAEELDKEIENIRLKYQDSIQTKYKGYQGNDEDEDEEYEGSSYRGGRNQYMRGRMVKQHYVDEEDYRSGGIYGPPPPPEEEYIPDEEFIPQRSEETKKVVEERTADIRKVVNNQQKALSKLREASESFDELTNEIRSIKQAFIENQYRRSVVIDDEYDEPVEPPSARYVRPQRDYRSMGMEDEPSDPPGGRYSRPYDDYLSASIYDDNSNGYQSRRSRYDQTTDSEYGSSVSRNKYLRSYESEDYTSSTSSYTPGSYLKNRENRYQSLPRSKSTFDDSYEPGGYVSRYGLEDDGAKGDDSGSAESGSSGYSSGYSSYSANSSKTSYGSKYGKLGRSKTLNEYDLDTSGGYMSGGFSSKFLQKVREKKATGEGGAAEKSREKPFKSRFLKKSFDSPSSYTPSTSVGSYKSKFSRSASESISSYTGSSAFDDSASNYVSASTALAPEPASTTEEATAET